MTTVLPNFNDSFHPFYDTVSVHADDIVIPNHFDKFLPTNNDDYNCITVIAPSIDRGATRWILNGRYITLGMYRDEGRSPAQPLTRYNLSWNRNGGVVTMNDPLGHKLRTDDQATISNTNVPTITTTITVVDLFTFSFTVPETGAVSGSEGAYQLSTMINFFETHRVFRLLPSFKLISIDRVRELFENTAPAEQPAYRQLFDITENEYITIPGEQNESVNYERAREPVLQDHLLERFNQVYDEVGDPIELKYQANGYPVSLDNVDSKHKNPQIFYNTPRSLEGSTPADTHVFVYDYYGLAINDPTRSPLLSSANITRDPVINGDRDNFKILDSRFIQNDFYDEFGNKAIGIQLTNALVVRKQILPLELDAFNKPLRKPLDDI